MKKYIKTNKFMNDDFLENLQVELEDAIQSWVDSFSKTYEFDDDEPLDISYTNSSRVEVSYEEKWYTDGTDAIVARVYIDGDLVYLIDGGEELDLREFGIDKTIYTPSREDQFIQILNEVISKYDKESYFERESYTTFISSIPV